MAGGRARRGVGARSDKETPKSAQMGKSSLVFSHLEPFAFSLPLACFALELLYLQEKKESQWVKGGVNSTGSGGSHLLNALFAVR